MEHICYNCFSDSLDENGICTACGFDGAKNREKFPQALPLGSILFGRYIVGRVLGQGGFGITYLAQDYQTKGRVAIKEFFPDTMASRTERTTVTPYSGERGENFAYGLNSFLDEAKTMAEFIGNPNITRVDSYFEENGTGYFVMEYLEGDSFLGYIQAHGGRITWDETMKVVLPVMNALEAMHEKGIIHRDVTPDNIYITKDGTVKLLDFGAARYSLGNVSRSLDVILKHGFAPKEQYSRRGRQGPYTDVYSLGATIYYAITGVKPDDAIERSDEDNMPMPTTLGAKITLAQEDALLKAMAVQPADRYQNMAQFRAALTAAQPVLEPKPEAPKPEPLKPEASVPSKSLAELMNHPQPQRIPPVERPKPQRTLLGARSSQPVKHQAAQPAKLDPRKSVPYRPEEDLPDPPGGPKKLPKWVMAVVAAVVAEVMLFAIGMGVKASQQKAAYRQAQEWLDTGELDKAAEAFEALGEYEDSAEKADIAKAYQQAQALMDDGKYFQAMRGFSELDYKDSAEKAQAAKEAYRVAQRSVSLSASDQHTVGLCGDGTVVATKYIGIHNYGQCKVSGWTDIVAVSAGMFHTVGLCSDGTVVATGYNKKGQCDVSGWTDIVAVSAGWDYTVGLRSDGTVVATGINTYGECDVSGWTDIVAVSAGYNCTVGLRSDGTVVATGDSDNGQCDVSGWTDIVAVSAGQYHTVGLRSDGTVVATGWNDYGQCDVSGWTDIVAVSSGDDHTVGLRRDGTVVATEYTGDKKFNHGQCNVSGWRDIVAVSTGGTHTVGLRSDGTVVATKYTGDQAFNRGQCDVSDWTDIRTP